jgi:(p)ppGpp synthase/HD superfamily hydrolase
MTRTSNEAELLKRAIICATEAHVSQCDKSAALYIYHPLRVMLAVRQLGTEYACCGVLHDIVEDTPVTLDYLSQELELPATIVEAVDAISERPGETHHQYLERCASNGIALECKIADIKDNMTRLSFLTGSKRKALAEKYESSINFLESIKRARRA